MLRNKGLSRERSTISPFKVHGKRYGISSLLDMPIIFDSIWKILKSLKDKARKSVLKTPNLASTMFLGGPYLHWEIWFGILTKVNRFSLSSEPENIQRERILFQSPW